MKKSIFSLLIVATVFLSGIVSAGAAPLGFNGDYDYSTWTKVGTHRADTTSTIDAVQQILTLMEPDNADLTDYECLYAGGCVFDFSHQITASGTVRFNWVFDSGIDHCCSGFNVAINATLYNLADGYPADPYHRSDASSGFFSASVNAGDTITFSAFSADGCCGAANTTITNFDAPAGQVPEPASLLLFGIAAAGLPLARRKQSA